MTDSSLGGNAFEAVALCRRWSRRITATNDVASLLRQWPCIQGFHQSFELHLLADLINIDLAANWGSLFKLCRDSTEEHDRTRLMFLFAIISFDGTIDMSAIRTLIAASIIDECKNLQLPQGTSFINFVPGQVPTVDYIMQYMNSHRVPYPGDERSFFGIAMHGKQRRKLELAQSRHEQQSEKSCRAFAQCLLAQWPCQEVSFSELQELPLFDAPAALSAINPEWNRLTNNDALTGHLKSFQRILDTLEPHEAVFGLTLTEEQQEYFEIPISTEVRPKIPDLLGKIQQSSTVFPEYTWTELAKIMVDDAQTMPIVTSFPPDQAIKAISTSESILKPVEIPAQRPNESLVLLAELRDIVQPFAHSTDQVRRTYGLDLENSINALEQSGMTIMKHLPDLSKIPNVPNLPSVISSTQALVKEQLNAICSLMSVGDEWLAAANLLPDMTPISLLGSLPYAASQKLLVVARDTIIKYGYSIMTLQHLLRIQSAQLRRDSSQLAHEMSLGSHTHWKARDHIDWFLLEIDFDLRIRSDQHEVAKAMIAPSTNTNSVLQMNMGQGKSSVVIPMIVAHLANSKNLVRVVVPRPLLQQTAQLLQARLGGLMGRKTKHVPFSRRSPTNQANLKAYHNIHVDVLQSCGVMLTLPEHILSFQLSGLQALSNGHIQQADTMIKLQDWMTRKSRDILDECDHMLAVKTQLIFPSGSQAMVDGHPTRWKVVQDILQVSS